LLENVKQQLEKVNNATYPSGMRSYHQYCALARALDVVGDRWTLLIVRELLTLGPSRYTDLRAGLPGIATNLLVDRLRELEAAGVVARVTSASTSSSAATLFQLTPRGKALAPVIRALGAWAGPTVGEWDPAEDEFRSLWLTLPLELHLADGEPAGPAASIEVRTGDRPLLIQTADGGVRVRPGSTERPDAVVSGPPDAVLATLLGRIPLTTARRRGVRVRGDEGVLARVQPRADPRDR
jgi:DNA-binding HxlR family transcriptional regulator